MSSEAMAPLARRKSVELVGLPASVLCLGRGVSGALHGLSQLSFCVDAAHVVTALPAQSLSEVKWNAGLLGELATLPRSRAQSLSEVKWNAGLGFDRVSDQPAHGRSR